MTEAARGLSPYRYEEHARAPDYERRSWQRFDRVGFALHALTLLAPPRTRIAVFRSNTLQVTQGIDLGRGPDARWVMLGIPADASAESIVLALTKIEGVGQHPYTLEASLRAARVTGDAN